MGNIYHPYNYCAKCGSHIDEDDLFCRGCGIAVRKEKETYFEHEPAAPTAKNVHAKWFYILILVGSLVILGAIVMVVLIFTIWNNNRGADSPEALAAMYMYSLETKNVQSYMDCFEFEHFEEIYWEGISEDNARSLLEAFMAMVDIWFEGVEPRKITRGDDHAEMIADEGTIITKGFIPMDYDASEYHMTFEMYMKDGS